MPARPFHLGWFLQGSSVQAWGEPWTGHIGKTWMKPELFLDMARSLERACFDYILLEDSSYVGESYQGSTKIYLENAIAVPRQDPSVVASLMTAVTSRIGIVPTFGTFAYPPYLLARLVATLDQVSDGRIGWNAVTGSSDYAAMNFGMKGMPEHDLRYDMADEYMQVVRGLWNSWEPGAIVADTDSGILVDASKVHAVNHEGKYFKCRGPINAPRSPQGRVPICQAGGSPRGKKFAARWADTIITEGGGSIETMKAYRDEIRRQAAAFGRNPDDIKVLFLAHPIIDTTMEAAHERQRLEEEQAQKHIDMQLSSMSRLTGIDFARFDLDQPLPLELTTNGHQSALAKWIGKTPRALVRSYARKDGINFTGTSDHVGGMMQEIIEEVGGDGFLIFNSFFDRRYIMEVCEGLVPELQRRGVTRKAYAHKHLRDNLLEF